MEKFNYGKCACLNYKDCINRIFKVYDFRNGKWIKISVCNEYFRLVFQKLEKDYGQVVEYIINDFLELTEGSFYFKNSGSINSIQNKTITICLCERPYVFFYFPIKNILELYLNGAYWFKEDLKKGLQELLLSSESKNRVTNLKRNTKILINKIGKYSKKENELFINEIINNMLILKTK